MAAYINRQDSCQDPTYSLWNSLSTVLRKWWNMHIHKTFTYHWEIMMSTTLIITEDIFHLWSLFLYCMWITFVSHIRYERHCIHTVVCKWSDWIFVSWHHHPIWMGCCGNNVGFGTYAGGTAFQLGSMRNNIHRLTLQAMVLSSLRARLSTDSHCVALLWLRIWCCHYVLCWEWQSEIQSEQPVCPNQEPLQKMYFMGLFFVIVVIVVVVVQASYNQSAYNLHMPKVGFGPLPSYYSIFFTHTTLTGPVF